jgi:glycosyltransferase involved in cell wall biosynthesis
MQAANLNAWAAAHLDKPYLTLGHGMSDTTNAGKLASTLETHLNKHAAHVLTYSDEGREYVTGKGIDPSKVTAFHNATDTRRLQHALQNSTLSVQTAFRTEHGIPTSASVALYLGALNRHKNIDLLVEAARLVFRADPNRWLVVAGDGEHRHKLERLASQSARVVMLGQANAEDYAPIAKSCTVLLNPGRVGLVAVDALVMGVPVLSTQTAAHAPEFAYLRPGIDVLETESTAEAYASAWLSVERSSNTTRTMYPSVEEAANTITQVILAVLRSDRLSVRR